jgi:hypothetical protein
VTPLVEDTTMTRSLRNLAASLSLAACASVPPVPEPPSSHPASPAAAPAPLPPRSDVLSWRFDADEDDVEPPAPKPMHHGGRHGR